MFRFNARFRKLPTTLEKRNLEDLVAVALKNDVKAKAKMKFYADKRFRAQTSLLKVGDKVLID